MPREPLESPPAARPVVVPEGIGLGRLLALARPTPPQALLLGLDLLEGLLAVAAEGPVPGAVDVVVTPDGRAAPGAAVRGRPAGQVLAELGAAARRPGADPAAEGLLAELDLAAAELAADGVGPAARRLRTAAGALDRARVRAELGALARAAAGPGSGGSGTLPGGARRVTGRPRPPDGGPRAGRAGRRIGAWLLSLVVLGAAVVAEVVLLGDTIRTDIELLLDAGRSGEQPVDEPEPDGLPVVPPAPAAAGSVTGVDLRALAPCAPGTPCTVRVLVGLVPSAEPRTVAWSYRVVDRCTGVSTTVPGGTVAVPPQADRAAVVADVPLPALPGLALLAVTDAPAVAASAPVDAGSCRPAGPDA
ncbi:hypothetical protein DQ239_01240 [Blastococcus sp. TF02-09]|uniref:hypothetical protein n=1 Tax=Blastococcus sp. TF02-09 TaxID=2250576 RepID=UPI000DEB2A0E|nr:hypothetical protein [Blastococcus sp. TF02-9]RBY81268.1 hypothetical protein DQ239_01240 [Blastococcus sp. TF02-9]